MEHSHHQEHTSEERDVLSQPKIPTTLSQEEKIELFARRRALEWHSANRGLHVKDEYDVHIDAIKKIMKEHGILEEEYEQYRTEVWKKLH